MSRGRGIIEELLMNWDSYFRVSALMFVEFTIWGAWLPVLAIRLLGPLRMTGKQVGWVYATVPLACTFAPFVSGYLADRWINVQWVLVVCHAAGAVLLFLAARQTTFRGMFCAMLVFSIFYTATPALVNKMLNLAFPADDPGLAWVQPWVFLWAPVAWALVGFLLTGMRQVWKLGGDGPDCLYVAAALSLIMVAISPCNRPASLFPLEIRWERPWPCCATPTTFCSF